jgi:hypothetical protein
MRRQRPNPSGIEKRATAPAIYRGCMTKSMTCKQLGGPCSLELRGETADEIIKAQDRHLNEAVASGEETHKVALDAMKGRWKHPLKGMGWYRQVKKDFAALPPD